MSLVYDGTVAIITYDPLYERPLFILVSRELALEGYPVHEVSAGYAFSEVYDYEDYNEFEKIMV